MTDTSESRPPAESAAGAPPVQPPPSPDTKEAPPPEAAGGATSRRPWSRWYLHPAVFLALVALILTGWDAWQTRLQMDQLRHDLAIRLADADTALGESRAMAMRAEAAVRELSSKLSAVEAQLAESQSQQAALEVLYQELSRNRDETALAEVEHLIQIANQQLVLAGNVNTALVALRNAEARLVRLDRPQFASLKRAVASAIQKLEGLPYVDIEGLSGRLEALIRRVDALPLAAHARPQPQPSPPLEVSGKPWLDFLRLAWHDLKDLVRIQRVDEPALPLLAPEQSFFLRENVKLRLLSARLALLARDEATYRADLAAAEDWLKRYFDTKARGVAEAVAEVGELAQASLSVDLPDISALLEAVRNVHLGGGDGRGR